MSLAEYLKCTKCASGCKLEKGIVECHTCGYRTGIASAPRCTDPAIASRDLLSHAYRLSRGLAICRSFLHSCVDKFVRLDGMVLDIGAGKRPSYLPLLAKQRFKYYSCDGDVTATPDLLISFEDGFPLRDGTFDSVLLLNVLEHVYDPRALLLEIHRLLKSGGTLYLYVPFLIKVHPCPSDFYRYTSFALNRLLQELGFGDVQIYTDGGLFRYFSEVVNALTPSFLQRLTFPVHFALCACDRLVDRLSRGRFPKAWPFGYFVKCMRP